MCTFLFFQNFFFLLTKMFFSAPGIQIDEPFTLLSLLTLFNFLGHPILAFKFLQKFQIFPENPKCRKAKCKGKIMNPQMRGNSICFRCTKCKRRVRAKTNKMCKFFKMAVDKFLLLIFFWANKESRSTAASYLGLPIKTVSRFFIKIESICSSKMRDSFLELKFGGKLRICEVDEAKMRKPKYNRGASLFKSRKWIFGIWDRSTHAGYCVPVPNRNYPTLAHIIRKYVLKGSVIYSDEWKAYRGLSKIGYIHRTVNHSKTFKNRVTNVHTNGIESFWSRLKAMYRAKKGVRDRDLGQFCNLFLWREKFGHTANDAFWHVLYHLGERH